MIKPRAIVPTDWGCETPFEDFFGSVLRQEPNTITSDDVLILEGGTDIGSDLYGQKPSKFTHSSDWKRDSKEWAQLSRFVQVGAPILAICRGAQLATAFLGGKLIQHITGHESYHGHPIVTNEGDIMVTSSLHHQLMFPFYLPPSKWKILAHTTHPLSTSYIDETNTDISHSFPNDFVEP